MLQRIQTLYMLLALSCLVAAFFAPVFSFLPGGVEGVPISIFTCRVDTGTTAIVGASETLEGWSNATAVLHTLALLLAFFAVVSYKKRPMQIRLLSLVNLLVFLTLGLSAYVYMKFTGGSSSLISGLNFGSALLIAVVLFNLMAINYIRRDEKLVRSMDRLR